MKEETILIIDDSEEQLEIHKHYLEDNYTVQCATSGPQGIIMVQAAIPDVILMDIEMPLMDGTETMTRIRRMKDCYNLPIIGLTGRTAKSTVLNFMSLGGSGYLAKPVKKDLLIKTIEEFITHERERANKQKILIIDDDQESLFMMKQFLKNTYYVTTLKSSRQAIDYIHKFTPDLILLDYQMAPYNGVSVFNMIRKIDQSENIPIAFVTGITDNDVLLELSALGPAGIILKPLNRDIFLTRIHSFLPDVPQNESESHAKEQDSEQDD